MAERKRSSTVPERSGQASPWSLLIRCVNRTQSSTGHCAAITGMEFTEQLFHYTGTSK
jgi:hypothetical protein